MMLRTSLEIILFKKCAEENREWLNQQSLIPALTRLEMKKEKMTETTNFIFVHILVFQLQPLALTLKILKLCLSTRCSSVNQ